MCGLCRDYRISAYFIIDGEPIITVTYAIKYVTQLSKGSQSDSKGIWLTGVKCQVMIVMQLYHMLACSWWKI